MIGITEPFTLKNSGRQMFCVSWEDRDMGYDHMLFKRNLEDIIIMIRYTIKKKKVKVVYRQNYKSPWKTRRTTIFHGHLTKYRERFLAMEVELIK